MENLEMGGDVIYQEPPMDFMEFIKYLFTDDPIYSKGFNIKAMEVLKNNRLEKRAISNSKIQKESSKETSKG